ncbi:MAG: Ig-like domain-containing protein [Saprospiraceae bacterium]|nr:Ig-like domain-containing protein [Saprospiraceae bacterium]
MISSNPTQNQQDIALNKEILIQFNYNSGNNTVVSLDQNMKEIRNILKFDIIKAELFENNTSILIRNNLSTRGTKQITINYSDLFKPNTNYKLKLSLKLSKASQTLKVETFELSFRTQSKPENLSPYVKMTIPENQNFYIQENNKKGFIF